MKYTPHAAIVLSVVGCTSTSVTASAPSDTSSPSHSADFEHIPPAEAGRRPPTQPVTNARAETCTRPSDAQPVYPGEVYFAAFGDMPYCVTGNEKPILCDPDAPKYKETVSILSKINRSGAGFAVFIGDFFEQGVPCDNNAYARTKVLFDHSSVPLLFIPGDNEFTDCVHPPDALSRFREYFVPATPTALAESRSAQRPENVIWTYGGLVFVALSTPGGGRTEPYKELERDSIGTLLQAFSRAERQSAPLVVFTHAQILPAAEPYTSLADAVTRRAKELREPVLLVHGDKHTFEVCRGDDGIRRIQVDDKTWAFVTYSPASKSFRVEQRTP